MKHLALAFALLVVACGGKSKAPSGPENSSEGDDTHLGGSDVVIVTLTGLTNGDVSCYVEITREDGTEDSLYGDFDLCEGGAHDATALIGQKVSYTTTKGAVLGDSCDGNPDCTESKEVDLVSTITAAAAQ